MQLYLESRAERKRSHDLPLKQLPWLTLGILICILKSEKISSPEVAFKLIVILWSKNEIKRLRTQHNQDIGYPEDIDVMTPMRFQDSQK